jgi:hypothetical protein
MIEEYKLGNWVWIWVIRPPIFFNKKRKENLMEAYEIQYNLNVWIIKWWFGMNLN